MLSLTTVSLGGIAAMPDLPLAATGAPIFPVGLFIVWAANFLLVAIGVFLLVRQNANREISNLEDAAKIDGLRGLSLFWRVKLGRLAPALGTIAALVLIGGIDDIAAALVETPGASSIPSKDGLASIALTAGLVVAGFQFLIPVFAAAFSTARNARGFR